MNEDKNNELSEKVHSINNNIINEKTEQKEAQCPSKEDQINTNLNISNIIQLYENDQTSIKEDKLKSFTPFSINPFYQILINKRMPSGYKLESEENLLKNDEKRHKSFLHRKHKKNSSSILESKIDSENNNLNIKNNEESKDNKDTIIKQKKTRKKIFPMGNEDNKGDDKENKENKSIAVRRMTREHKPKIIEDLGYIDKDVIKGKSNPLFRAVNKICEKGLMKMKKIPYYSFFYNSSKPDEPSLNKIEKNIRDFKYQSTYEFIMDLRRLWNHFLKIYNDQIEIKERVCEMCRISEKLYWDLESINIEKVELEEMNKKVDSLERKLRELKGNTLQFNMGGFSLKKTNSNERSMSLNEKTIIKNNIKLLTIE
jgi:hypothetical protein